MLFQLNIAGSFAENLPIFHLVGMPASAVQKSGKVLHHTLGNGDFDVFYQISQPLVCVHALMTPENCVAETERLIRCALQERRPVYMGFAADYAVMPIHEPASFVAPVLPISDKQTLTEATTAILDKLKASGSICILPGILSSRLGLAKELQDLIDRMRLPYATMFSDKSVLSESNRHYIGMYDGQLMNEHVRKFVEGCNCVMGVGAVMTDFNSGNFTANIDREHYISIMAKHVKVGSALYQPVYMQYVLLKLKEILPCFSNKGPSAHGLGEPVCSKDGKITVEYLYPRLEKMFRKDDIIIAETGSSALGLAFALLPQDAVFHHQASWGSIGWATSAALGIALAAPHRRVILVTGEGSHQVTAQEVCQFARFGLKPVILVLNNDGYLIERLLCI